MMRPGRFIVVAVLAAFFIALPSQGLALRTEDFESRAVSLGDWGGWALGWLWAFVAKEGGSADPNGTCFAGQACGKPKEGLNVDPHGLCVAGQACGQQQPVGEEGINVDPSGGK